MPETTTTPAVVPAGETTAPATPEATVTTTEGKDYKAMYENMQQALKEERNQRKERDAKLTTYEQKEKDEQEKQMKAKGKYEELLTEKEKALADATEKAKKWEEYEARVTKERAEKLETLDKTYPKELKEKF